MSQIIRAFDNNFNVVDWTKEVNIIPNSWGTIQRLGLFATEPVHEQTVTFQEVKQTFGLIQDRVRGDRSNVGVDYSRKLHSIPIPHFPLAEQILPKDIQGKSAYSNLSEAETLDGVRMRKMEYIRKSHAATLEKARAQLLTAGTYYAPNGTVSGNIFTEMAVTQTTVDFVFGTAATNIVSKIEAVIAAIQDNAGTNSIDGVMFLCSPQFFAKLIGHQYVVNAYQYYTSSGAAEPLRKRLSADGSARTIQRTFEYGGAIFIEMRDSFKDATGTMTQLIPSGDAVAVPTGTDFFRTYFAPAERFGLVNTLGMEVYFFEQADPAGTAINIDSESNFLNFMQKPNMIVRAFSSN